MSSGGFVVSSGGFVVSSGGFVVSSFETYSFLS